MADVDEESFRAFYAEVRDRVASALALTLGDSVLGTEAADEAMARAFERWRRVGRMDNPAGWVYRVGLNWARRRYKRLDAEQLTAAVAEGIEGGPDVAGAIDVSAALRSLPADQRSVVVLRYVLDLTLQGVAETLEIPVGTVKSRLHRAHERLASIMEVTS